MICKDCGREIPENSIYCCWCGVRQLRERRGRGEVKVPAPKQLPSGNWTVYLRAEGQSVTEPTRELCLARALLPEIQAFFESEDGQREYAEWKAKQQAEQENKA